MELTTENFKKLIAENEKQRAENEKQRAEIKLLNEKLQFLMKKLFGSSSEKVNPNQLALLFADNTSTEDAVAHEKSEDIALEVEEIKSIKKRPKRKALGDRIPDDLPVEEVIIEPEEVKTKPELFKKIGEEITEELDVTPTRFFKRRIIRPKYKRINDRDCPPIVAPAPKRIINNSYASTGLLVYIVLRKYADHLPLYRQEQIFKTRHGVELSRKTMSRWMHLVSSWLGMICKSIKDEIRQSGYMQADETCVSYQNPGSGKSGQGYLWVYHSPNSGVVFEWFPSRSADCLKNMLQDYNGVLQTDGYRAYDSFLNRKENQSLKNEVVRAACWAHARRKFFEAKDTSKFANKIVQEIQQLYKIEKELRGTSAQTRLKARKEKSVPILNQIKIELENELPKSLPKSQIGNAINYTLNLWEQLNAFTKDGQIEIDNNLVENAIRPTAIGKKNWLFFGSADAGKNSAILYSIIETCRKLDINPEEYLKDILGQTNMTAVQAKSFTPKQWKLNKK